eukprot:TRINITY_DN95_c0_g1_i1.p1 TRINITY_DN95_c0_g1~~TRINITY_DN95_c0_g1_i1.p1  ORF type:complete len:286 (+),score=100.32 TRINITY_DN95_c0_g1_i1:122-979(+)
MMKQTLLLVLFCFFCSFNLNAAQTVSVVSATCVPTFGGRTVLTGSNLNNTRLVIMIGSLLCSDLRVLPYSQLSCVVPAGTGSNLNISVNYVAMATKFSFCAPSVTSASLTGDVLTVSGSNFGSDSTKITAMVKRVFTNETFPCLGVSVTRSHNQFTCNINNASTALNGQYWVSVAVSQVSNPDSNKVYISSGVCYQRSGVPQANLDSSLLLAGLKKNSQAMKELVQKLSDVKKSLPPLEGSCDGNCDMLYPVGFAALQDAASNSYVFKDCVDTFSVNVENYLMGL